MKRNFFCGILAAVAIMIAVGSVTVLGPCVHEDGSAAACARAGTGILIDGCALVAIAVAILLTRKPSVRIGLFYLALCTSGAGILLPGTLFPLCKMDTMHCRAVMQPAMIILCTVSMISSAGGIMKEKSGIRRQQGKK